MFEFLHRSEYINAKNNEEYFHFGFVDVPLPSWGTVLNYFDTTLNIFHDEQNSDQKEKNAIFRTFNDYEFVFNFALNETKEGKIFVDFLRAISLSHYSHRKKQTFIALNFLSLSSISETLPRHTDVMDVWCWQILGKTHMMVEGKGRVFDKVLEPGELIYIPRGMHHATKSMGPRSLISFGAENIGTKNDRT